MTDQHYCLFNSADYCLSPYINKEIFNESLLLNILFQEKILFHESFYFDSSLLAEHLGEKKGEMSLFELATRKGIIIPAFRNRSVGSLSEAEVIMKQENVYGKNYELLRPFMTKHISNLKSAVDDCLKSNRAYYWPEDTNSAMGFYNAITTYLQRDSVPDYVTDCDRIQMFERVWNKTVPWRYEVTEKAFERSKSKGVNGLQRADLFWAIGQHLGFKEDNISVSVNELINACQDKEKKLAMEIYLKWVTQCHHIGQAKAFSASINFPVYNIETDFIIDTVMRSPLDNPPEANEGFRCEVYLPKMEELMRVDAKELVSIRNDLGNGYLYSLKQWNNNPSERNQQDVIRDLENYCEQICFRYQKIRPSLVVASFSDLGQSDLRAIADNMIDIADKTNLLPKIGIFSSFYKLFGATYSYITNSRAPDPIFSNKENIEITLPYR